jgi:hypothetical protein
LPIIKNMHPKYFIKTTIALFNKFNNKNDYIKLIIRQE